MTVYVASIDTPVPEAVTVPTEARAPTPLTKMSVGVCTLPPKLTVPTRPSACGTSAYCKVVVLKTGKLTVTLPVAFSGVSGRASRKV